MFHSVSPMNNINPRLYLKVLIELTYLYINFHLYLKMTEFKRALNYPKELKTIILKYQETVIKVVKNKETKYYSKDEFLELKDKKQITNITVYGNLTLEDAENVLERKNCNF